MDNNDILNRLVERLEQTADKLESRIRELEKTDAVDSVVNSNFKNEINDLRKQVEGLSTDAGLSLDQIKKWKIGAGVLIATGTLVFAIISFFGNISQIKQFFIG